MLKIAALIWIILGTTLAGVAMTVIVSVPQLNDNAMFWIPVLCGAAAVAAIPISYLVARAIAREGRMAR